MVIQSLAIATAHLDIDEARPAGVRDGLDRRNSSHSGVCGTIRRWPGLPDPRSGSSVTGSWSIQSYVTELLRKSFRLSKNMEK